jgi:hypothetical protein
MSNTRLLCGCILYAETEFADTISQLVKNDSSLRIAISS